MPTRLPAMPWLSSISLITVDLELGFGVLPNPHVLAQRGVIDAGDVRCPCDMRELATGSDEHHVEDHEAIGIETAKPVLALDPRHKQALETARRELPTDPRLSFPELVL